MNDPRLLQLFRLWNSCSVSCHPKGGPYMIIYQNIWCSVLVCYVTKSSKYVADPTWVQSTAQHDILCSDYFVVDDMVYMGTVNNSKNT